ncbi:hypothetical protein GCM10010174_12840 [Kutzneria viridogrisea]|uniref:Uncharacterized protein n=2 Tax=Kutzneria TaxID=43356 RepID=W5WKM4_9PSEU|nr:hypothetical protein [Kutzneria albida]AHI01112.1 hypothetical protein KALB_7754 [Kutzneria albida DSM 43870]MBA8926367.1 hypothetical protein [Kutzneria viridogrisea]
MSVTFHDAADAVDHVVDLMLETLVPLDELTEGNRVDFLSGMALAAEALRAAGRGEHERADELGRSASDNLRRAGSIDLMLPEDEG